MHEKIQKNDLSIAILAGGKSSRMNGEDKGLMKLKKQYVIKRIIKIADQFSNDVIIVANSNIHKYEQFRIPIHSDVMEGYQGPLSGIYTALCICKNKYIIVLPCDGPFISERYFIDLLNYKTKKSIITVKTGDRLQPVYARFDKNIKDNLKNFLKSNERKIDRWYNKCTFDTILYDNNDEMFINFNSHEDITNNKLLVDKYYG